MRDFVGRYEIDWDSVAQLMKMIGDSFGLDLVNDLNISLYPSTSIDRNNKLNPVLDKRYSLAVGKRGTGVTSNPFVSICMTPTGKTLILVWEKRLPYLATVAHLVERLPGLKKLDGVDVVISNLASHVFSAEWDWVKKEKK